jgi:fumarate reductase subunit C
MKKKTIDRTPARLDFIQSATGLILALFIMGHLLFEASILISNELMYKVTIMFEGYYFFGERYPGIISFLAGSIFAIFILHAAIALRKFPSKYHEYKTMREHTARMKHEDSSLWMIQVITGFAMFFLGSIHLYTMISQPENIGPYASSFRVVHEWMAPVYALLLFSVVTHAFIGFYRLMLKWGFLEGADSKKTRKVHKFLMRSFILIYLVVGSLSLAKYVQIGLTHDYSKTERYQPHTTQTEQQK